MSKRERILAQVAALDAQIIRESSFGNYRLVEALEERKDQLLAKLED